MAFKCHYELAAQKYCTGCSKWLPLNQDFFTGCPYSYVLIHNHVPYDHGFGGKIPINMLVLVFKHNELILSSHTFPAVSREACVGLKNCLVKSSFLSRS